VAEARVAIQAFGWHAQTVTNAAGEFSFGGLGNPVTYTLTLPGVTALTVDVRGEWGKITTVVFQQAK
jgi:hypothetical protein